jgi:hypothetical protein
LGTALIIVAGPEAFINRKVLANRALVLIGLISYPLYLWHWPLLVAANRTFPDENLTPIAIVCAFVLAWLTYRFIERPVRSMRPILIRNAIFTLILGMTIVALMGGLAVQRNGAPERFPEIVRELLSRNHVFNIVDQSMLDEAANGPRPTLLLWGDSHAEHLLYGLLYLRNQRHFRLIWQKWDDCASVNVVKKRDEKRCRDVNSKVAEAITKLKPDIVIIAAFWAGRKHPERVEENLAFLKRLGVQRVVVVGGVQTWRNPLPRTLYDAFTKDPLRRIPKRLLGPMMVFPRDFLQVEHAIEKIASKFDATFISPTKILCNLRGCLVRIGEKATDIIQIDLNHFSQQGSRYFINQIAS